MPNIFDVAHYILQQRGPTPPIKLQLMCYYAQARHLARTDGTALFMQDFVASPACPICPELDQLDQLDHEFYMLEIKDIPQDKLSGTLRPEQEVIISHVIRVYDLHDIQSMAGASRLDLPWVNANNIRLSKQPLDASYPVITKDNMYDYYARLGG